MSVRSNAHTSITTNLPCYIGNKYSKYGWNWTNRKKVRAVLAPDPKMPEIDKLWENQWKLTSVIVHLFSQQVLTTI